MRYLLENEYLRVEVDSHGAELKSVKNKDTGLEYMWQGDPAYWGRTSPVLFPFVGSLKNGSYTYKGVTYPMGQHGFARDMEHQLVKKSETSVYFSLPSNEETYKKYPFSFDLRLGYELEGKELKVLWEVYNSSSDEVLHFSIGAHPAFNCPIHGDDSKVGYKLSFANANEIHHHGHTDNGLSIEEDIVLPLENHCATITPDFFDGSTYIIEGPQTTEIGIIDSKDQLYVNVIFDMPLVAIWSPPKKNAPFLCIEPWFGRCDGVDFEGELSERAFNNTLEAGKTFQTSYTIQFF